LPENDHLVDDFFEAEEELQKPIDDKTMKDFQFYKCITTELVRMDELHPIPESFVTFDRQV
tara:strand:- start:360 stop:542 length:183 start_codon:yes stop_codon:yes gene_type:complete